MGVRLVDRAGELDVGRSFLASLSDGPGALFIRGEPGIGKTTLWAALVDEAASRGIRVLRAAPSAAEVDAAFGGLADLLLDVTGDELAGLPPPQRHAVSAALLREAADPGGVDPRAVAAGTLSIVTALNRSCAVLIAVDDLQWLDRASEKVAEFVARRLSGLRVGLLGCYRTESATETDARWYDSVPQFEERRSSTLTLGPLSDAAIAHLVHQRADGPLSRRAGAKLLDVAAGNPFFAIELARSLDAASRPVDGDPDGPLPRSLRDVVRARLTHLPAELGQTLVAASLMRLPTVGALAAVLGQPASVIRGHVEIAANAGVVTFDASTWAVRFVHPLYAAGVGAAVAPDTRRLLHARIAETSTNPEDRATHLALAADGPDETLAGLLDRAAEHARLRGALDSAGDLAEHALRLTAATDSDTFVRRALAVAICRFHAGEADAAQRLLDQVRTLPVADLLHAQVLRLLGEISYHQSSFGDGVRYFQAALEVASGDVALTAQLRLVLAFASVSAFDFAGARAQAQAARELVGRIDDAGAVAEILAVSCVADFVSGVPYDDDDLQRALAMEDLSRHTVIAVRPSLVAGCIRTYEGRLAEAVELLGVVRAAALERGRDSDLPMILSSLSWALCWQGRLDEAVATVDDAIEVAARLGSPPAECLALAYGAAAVAYRGDLARTQAAADRIASIMGGTGWSNLALWISWGLGVAALSTGDSAAAVQALDPMIRVVECEGLPEPVRYMVVADAIEALIGTGDHQRAAALIDVLEESACRRNRAWAQVGALRCRALLEAAAGDLERAAATADRTVTCCDGLELTLEVARTHLVAGQIARRRRRKREARNHLELALRMFTDAGAMLWTERAREDLARVRSTGAAAEDGLTPTEQRVAQLASTGLTNRQVAERVHISTKTVEANLSRIYRKLGIHSRAELGARFADDLTRTDPP